MADDEAFSLTVEVTRGTSTDDRDKMKATVGAASIGELEERVDALRERMEVWAEDLRSVQPTGTVRDVADGQTTLGEGEA